jgi:hypothetical protein
MVPAKSLSRAFLNEVPYTRETAGGPLDTPALRSGDRVHDCGGSAGVSSRARPAAETQRSPPELEMTPGFSEKAFAMENACAPVCQRLSE